MSTKRKKTKKKNSRGGQPSRAFWADEVRPPPVEPVTPEINLLDHPYLGSNFHLWPVIHLPDVNTDAQP